MAERVPWFVRWFPRVFYVVAALGLVYTLFGSIDAVDSVLSFILAWFVPVPVLDWATMVGALLLGAALERRKRAGWRMAMVVLAGMLALYLLLAVVVWVTLASEPDAASVIDQSAEWELAANITLLVIAITLMCVYRRWYSSRSQPGNVRRALLTLVGGIVVSTLIALGIQYAIAGFGSEQTLALFRDMLGLGTDDPTTQPLLLSALGLAWAVSLVVSFWMLLRSQRDSARMSLADEVQVRRLLAINPTDSLGYFATRRDKSLLQAGDAAIAYRVEVDVCLAAGDPLGDQAHWPAAAKAFIEHATQHGWRPAVIGASQAGAHIYRQAGLRALHIGDEAVLRADRFSLDELPEVRRAVRRLRGLGYDCVVRRHSAIGQDELAQLIALADEWRAGGDERGFSMALGRLGDPADGDCVMVEARFPEGDERGRTAALLSFVPWGADGLSLDVMRRHPSADHGVTEFMVAGLMGSSQNIGIARASLNFAVFRSAFSEGARIGAGPVQRLWRKLLMFASRWWQLESLYRSNEKYDPLWVPRLICYPDSTDFGRVVTAMGIAEGYVTLPRWLGGGEDPQPIYTAACAAPLLEVARPALPAPPERKLPEQVRGRMAARQAMLDDGEQPYPATFAVSATCAAASGSARVAGRVIGIRDHGGVTFVMLRDWSGDLQLMLESDRLGAESLRRFGSIVRLGDQIGASGETGSSRTGTRSLLVDGWAVTSKALRPLPDKHAGIRDPEARVRQRYVDLIVNQRQRDLLRTRSAAFRAVRETLQDRGYLEVETPILQPVHGGANARPFTTHINAYNLGLYLRIAPELYLKRLMVGGVDRVFEMGRNFRNEGADATHNPEFTMLEAYQSYADYNIMRDVVRDIVLNAARAALGTTVVRGRVGGVEHEIDLAEPWQVVTITDAVSNGVGEHVTADTPLPTLHRYADALDINYDPRWGWGAMLQELYEHLAESSTVTPTFFSDFPAETSPLTRPHRQDDRLAERWDLIIFGSELGTAYSELVDPVLQRDRLTSQSLAAAHGDPEAMELDEAFLLALEYGMPPSGGLGMGLDRLVMMLTNASIRETIAFPLVKPRDI